MKTTRKLPRCNECYRKPQQGDPAGLILFLIAACALWAAVCGGLL